MHSSWLVKIVYGNVFISFHIEKYRVNCVGIVKLCLKFSISLTYIRLFVLSLTLIVSPASVFTISKNGFLGEAFVGPSHFLQHYCHPVLHSAHSKDILPELHHLPLGWDHGCGNLLIIVTVLEPQWGYIIKHLKCTHKEIHRHFRNEASRMEVYAALALLQRNASDS